MFVLSEWYIRGCQSWTIFYLTSNFFFVNIMRWQKTSGLANQKSPTLTTPKCIKYQKISYISLFCIRMRTNSSTFERTHSMPKLPVSTCMMLRPRKATLQQFHCNLQVHSLQIQSWNMLPLIISCHCRMSVIYFAAYPTHKEIRA